MFDSLFESAYSVGDLTRVIKQVIEGSELLQQVRVSGEVSNFKRAASGHWYFTLKDHEAQLKCVMWRSAAERQPITPQDGDAVTVSGAVNVYETQGVYQLYATNLRPLGVGNLYAQFEALKARLEAEGLFDPARKRPLPTFPQVIGIVTSAEAAAFQDVQNVLRRRYPLAQVLLSPTLVQGADAPPQIIRALERLNARPDVAVILLVRGGGSIEDLWAFNDERVARAVAASRLPVVTGVGHEVDFTIVDFVADLRAPTPSAAAELITPDADELRATVSAAQSVLSGLLQAALAARQADLAAAVRTLGHLTPQRRWDTLRQRLDDWNAHLAHVQAARLAQLRERLNGRQAALEAANPQAILGRGYALVRRSSDGQPITQAAGTAAGVGITLHFQDGELVARVEDKNTHGHYANKLF